MPEVMSIEVDEEFDPRPPKQPFSFRDDEGKLNWPLIAGLVLAVILVIALIIVVVNPFATEKKAAVSTWTPKDPTTEANFLETYPATSAMVDSMQIALEDWARFYTTGKLTDLNSSFDLAGPQYAQLVSEQPKVAAAPEPGDPSIIQLGPVGEVSRKNNIYTTRVVVTWTKPGTNDPKEYRWDIDMTSDENRFRLYAVKETDPDEKQPIDFCGAVNLVAQLDDDDKLAKETATMPADRQYKVTVDTLNIRLKVWELLETAVAGTDSEQDVTPIVANYQSLVDASRKAKSLDELAATQQENDITDNVASIVERASMECEGADISKR